MEWIAHYGEGVPEFSSGGCSVSVGVAVSAGGDVGVGVLLGCGVTEAV